MPKLLAVDLGIRAGFALYADTGRLLNYRSQNFGSAARLRRAIPTILTQEEPLSWLIIEGGGPLAAPWLRQAAKSHIHCCQISAEEWRADLLYPRDQRSGAQAKQVADQIARQVIDWSGAAKATSLRHDAAEAILIGLWGVIHVGWLDEVPAALKR